MYACNAPLHAYGTPPTCPWCPQYMPAMPPYMQAGIDLGEGEDSLELTSVNSGVMSCVVTLTLTLTVTTKHLTFDES